MSITQNYHMDCRLLSVNNDAINDHNILLGEEAKLLS